jgi:membrane protein required for beta-lactamase induction
LIELIRSVVCWTLWLERNNVTFNSSFPSSFRTLGLIIINLATFWCKTRNFSCFLHLSLILPLGVEALPLQVGEAPLVVEDLEAMAVAGSGPGHTDVAD